MIEIAIVAVFFALASVVAEIIRVSQLKVDKIERVRKLLLEAANERDSQDK